MDLKKTYCEVKTTIDSLDFEKIWPGFSPLRFALYDHERCFFDGAFIEKTDEFCANTSIVYHGEQIAIWMVQEELEIPVLASKMVHEMFHGYQQLQGWTCWPKETEALFRYEYSAGNLSLKVRENELLLRMMDGFDEGDFRELLGHRKLRSEKYPYAFSYESKVEEIEGTANYVEWQVLRQLDEQKAAAMTDRMRERLTKPEFFFPIRISCYFTGALMVHALRSAGIYSFDAAERPAIMRVLKSTKSSDGGFPEKEAMVQLVNEAISAYDAQTEAIVASALEKNDVVLRGPFPLVTVNVYNARRCRDCITSTYFLMYRDGEEDRILEGDFVIRMKDETTIDTVFRW